MVLHRIQDMGVDVLTKCSPKGHVTRFAKDESDVEIFSGLQLQDDSIHEADLVIYAIGIQPRGDLARASGIQCSSRGGIVVGDDLKTSAEDVYAIGECASWKGNTYGLIGPGSESFFLYLSSPLLTRAKLKWPTFLPSTSPRLTLMRLES